MQSINGILKFSAAVYFYKNGAREAGDYFRAVITVAIALWTHSAR